MYLTSLTLRNFRNYGALDLALPEGLSVFSGGNGQGKSNLLEAVYALAITRSHRAESDRDVIRLAAMDEVGYTRMLGVVRRGNGREFRIQMDMALLPARRRADVAAGTLQKRIRVDGIPRSAADAIGSMAAVLFSVDDMGLVTGPPAGHRRYLDVLLSQADRAYLRSLQRYQKVLAQRNHLLRRIRDGQAAEDELPFWDGELCGHGGTIFVGRRRAMSVLAPRALEAHERLAPGEGPLDLQYRPSMDVAGDSAEGVAERMAEGLRALRSREVRLGQSLVGPHRDDLGFLVAGLDAAKYGSRGQIRTVALALRLAEARFLAETSGDEPILLLDDVLSELDGSRQREVLRVALGAQQAILTMVDTTSYPGPVASVAASFVVERGAVVPRPLGTRRGLGHNDGVDAPE